jgi:hypothetical protein
LGLIYSNSWQLLIWLGGEADDSAWAVAALIEFAKSIHKDEAATHAYKELFFSDQSFRRTLSAVTAE